MFETMFWNETERRSRSRKPAICSAAAPSPARVRPPGSPRGLRLPQEQPAAKSTCLNLSAGGNSAAGDRQEPRATASSAAAPLSPPSAPCSSPPRSPAAISTGTTPSHFESTDDAFIAARQFAIAPKVSGYVTAVPVTDNQHVDAGDVIARIDDRDYRVALEQAEAQVAARAGRHRRISTRRSTCSRHRSPPARRRSSRRRRRCVFAQQQAARYQDLAQTGYGTVQNAQQFTSQLQPAAGRARERAGDAQAGAAADRVR